MAQPRVFVTQQPKPNRTGWMPNLSPASKFGAIHYVFEPHEQPFTDTVSAMNKASDVLRDFDCENDFILWPNTGDPAAAFAVMLDLALTGYDKIKVLYWQREMKDGVRSSEGFYIPITFHLN